MFHKSDDTECWDDHAEYCDSVHEILIGIYAMKRGEGEKDLTYLYVSQMRREEATNLLLRHAIWQIPDYNLHNE